MSKLKILPFGCRGTRSISGNYCRDLLIFHGVMLLIGLVCFALAFVDPDIIAGAFLAPAAILAGILNVLIYREFRSKDAPDGKEK